MPEESRDNRKLQETKERRQRRKEWLSKQEISNSEQTKLCPFCAEEIKKASIVCKHCNRDLPEENETIVHRSKEKQVLLFIEGKISHWSKEYDNIMQFLDERREFYNRAFDSLIRAEKGDRFLASLNPLSLLFPGKKKHTEEYRDTWIEEMMDQDVMVELRIKYGGGGGLKLAESQLNKFLDDKEKLLNNEMDSERYEEYLDYI